MIVRKIRNWVASVAYIIIVLAFYATAWAKGGEESSGGMSTETFRTFLDCAVIVLVAYVGYQATRRDKQADARDQFIERIAKMIWGDGENNKGLGTRVSVLENNFDRCDTCNGEHPHKRSNDNDGVHCHTRRGDE